MDFRQVFSDPAVKQEFLDRFGDLADHARSITGNGLEGLEGGVDVDEAAAAAEDMAEGTFQPGSNPGLEAIVERFTRPVHLVRGTTFDEPPDDFPNSAEITSRLETARKHIERVIPSAGRIDLRNHRLDWVGTGWMVAPGIAVTNRHVAAEFAFARDGGFAFRQYFGAPAVRAAIDWRHEHEVQEESRFRVQEVLWIEPDQSVDVAVLRIAERGEDDQPQPEPVELMTRDEFRSLDVGSWLGVVGYPAYDSRNDAADQQRIFDGVYNVKRLAPGQVLAVVQQDVLHHDATTLGGNSGSMVVDLASGKAVGIHFGGVQSSRNYAVQAPRLQEVLRPFLD
jgi:endonuclease G